jgi:pimeloyl-ACP methyl ester carboxylesterase
MRVVMGRRYARSRRLVGLIRGTVLKSNGAVTRNEPHTEALAAATIAGRGLAATTKGIGDIHAAISRRVFTMTGRPSIPVRLMHDGISRSVYAAVGGGARAATYAAGHVAGAVASQRARAAGYVRFADRPRSELVVGALNGAWGDTFVKWRNPFALGMTIRHEGSDVDLTRDALAATYPEASGDVVVFLHGLCETDRAWWRKAGEQYGDPDSTHGSRLAAATDATPVYLRYNTGLHISDNGESLAELLDQLCDGWPVPVERLTLVGHSMGGLVIRSACCHAEEQKAPWVERVGRIVYLGSPHLGAPLEVAATAAGIALRKLPETRPLATALASRSVGIKDLRYGDIRPADWADIRDPDAWRQEPAECAPLLESAEHYYIGVTLTKQQDHPVARMIGDSLVTFPSASGSGPRRRLALDIDRGRHLGGLNHFDLLNHPRAWAVLESWLCAR